MTTDTKRLRRIGYAIQVELNNDSGLLIKAAADEIDTLRTRLEVDDKIGYDGIECRDVTISGQDKAIDGLRADNKRLREVLQSIADCCDEDHAARDYCSRQTEIRGIARAALQGESKP